MIVCSIFLLLRQIIENYEIIDDENFEYRKYQIIETCRKYEKCKYQNYEKYSNTGKFGKGRKTQEKCIKFKKSEKIYNAEKCIKI